MPQPAGKGELLHTLHSSANELERLLATIPAKHLAPSGEGDELTLKDTLAHIAYWQDSLADRIEAVLHNRPIEPPPGVPQAEVDRLNRLAVESSRSRTWSQVHSDLQNSFHRITRLVESIDEAELFGQSRFHAIDHAPLWQTIADESYEHYNEHLDFVRSWQEER